MQLSDRIGRRMKLHDLHVLMAVVQAGSMGKAAERLNTSQPNISRSIAELEHTLGVRLLDRHREGVEPTKYGRALLDCGAAVFDDLRQGVNNIEFLTDATAGEVRIGSIPVAANFVSAVVDRLSRSYPRIVFHVIAAQTEALHAELRARNVDLLVARRLGHFAEERFGFDMLYDDTYVVVAGARNPWVGRRKVELAELMGASWVLPPPESAIGMVVLEAFRASGLDVPRSSVVTLSREVQMNLLATGRFLAMSPASVLKLSGALLDLRALPVDMPLARAPIGIVTLKTRTLSSVARLFIDHAREVAKPLTKKKR
jgi:DNA-binding transcriptional LysR family regulator